MSARLYQEFEALTCESCRKPLGKAQLDCPRLGQSGEQDCAYRVEERSIGSGSGRGSRIIQFLIGLALIISAASPWLGAGDGLFGGFSPWISGFGLIFLGVWIYRVFGRKVLIENPSTGQQLVQIILFGIELNRTEVTAVTPVVWQGSPAREMRYPASVAELYREGNAVELVSTALLQLMAQGAIMAGVSQVRKRIGRSVERYWLAAAEGGMEAPVKGELEQRILAVVQSGPAGGLRLDEMVRKVLEDCRSHPRNYLIAEVIGPEAEKLGLGEVRGNLNKELIPAPNTRGRIARDIQSLEMLYRDFWVMMPEHAPVILAEVDRLVILMTRAGLRGSLEEQAD